MKNITIPIPKREKDLPAFIPGINVSSGALKWASNEEIVQETRCHFDLGAVPLGFDGIRGKRLVVFTTADQRITGICLAAEFNNRTKNLTLRDLNDEPDDE